MSSNNNDEECLMHSKMVIAIEIIQKIQKNRNYN